MAPHKHKKKKKSNKKHKKQKMSSSDGEDEFWKVPLSDSGSDSSQNGKMLTSLVRKSYMKHMKEVLFENIKNGVETSDPCDSSVHELASKWASYFDQKALRASMLSELYRKSMVSSIKAINARTSVRKMYIDEEMLSTLNLTSSKETQTEDVGLKNLCEVEIQTDNPMSKTVCVAETQTDLPLPSLLELPLPKTLTLSPSRPYDPAINFSDSSPDSVSCSQPQQSVTTTSVNQDICSITSTSDLLHNKRLENATSTTPGATVKVADIDTINNKSHQEDVNVKTDLNTRLAAMGLLNDTENDWDGNKSKKSNWYAEEIAQSCNFTRIMLKMTTKQRKRVLGKIKELFGDDDESLTELSEENIRVCRKRIASVVVMELTPIYQAKRIASRYLFKLVAKKLTNSIMDQSYAPDSRSIRKKVHQFFSNGHVIMSEADCG